MAENHVRVFDTTLRDGEQAPGFSLRPAEKLQLARQIDALGVDVIEAGFPIASPADAEAVRQIATEIRRPVIACLARCHRADLPRGNPAHVHVDERMRLTELGDERQHGVDRGFVGADQDPPAPQVAKVLDRAFSLFREAEQTLRVITEKAPGLGQGGVLGGPVEQAFPDRFLQPADRLADCRLGPVEFHGRPGEAPFGRYLQKDA